MATKFHSATDYGSGLYRALLDFSSSTLTKPQKRWRIACIAIHFSLSLAKSIINGRRNHKYSEISGSTSHTVLEIDTVSSLDLSSSTNLVPESCFPIVDQTKLRDMVKNKSMDELRQFDGVDGIAKLLKTDLENGIPGDEDDKKKRRTAFGSNTYQTLPPKGLMYFVVEAFKDTTIIILLACAALSLAFGIREHGIQEGWYEGGSICVAVFLVVVVSAASNFRQERQFDKLSKISSNINIDVVRDGRRQKISIFNVAVGDVVFLTIGDQIPADGLFIDGHSFQVDESSLTGESDHVEVDSKHNPFLMSGSKVANGYSRMLVISVGMNTAWGKMMSSITKDSNEQTPLQERLNKLTTSIGKRMMADQAMVRNLSGCETMGSATVICTDKTGTLTMNQMKVTKFWLGHDNMEEDQYSQAIALDLQELFHQGIGFNTTGSIYKPKSESIIEYSGSPTEKAILSWAVQDLHMDIEKLKQNYTIIHVETFNSEKKRSGILIKKKVDNTNHVHWKGAAEMVLAMCTHYYQGTGEVKSITENERSQFENIIQGMSASSLRCIAFAYKQIEPEKVQCDEDDLTLLGIVGLKDPCRPGAKKAIESCRMAGVQIKMITGDNVFTAKAIATECGILSSDQEHGVGEVIEGSEFRNYTPEERFLKVNKIRVMARSSPMDKLMMVQCLKLKGHVVAVTGDGTNDAPALKEADVGLSMGIQGTEVAKESSDIVILDDDFASVATVLKWGRCVYNNIQKFIQFQLTVNVAALVINFIAAVSAGDVPLTTVQLLWVNLIMDTLGALALATERPTDELMHNPPVGRTEPLITKIMWRNLLAQAIYQIAVLLTFQFKGKSIFNVEEKVKDTLIFNTFVLCQVFNEFNSRNLEKKNVFKGIHKNGLFLGIIAVTLILQVVMVEFLKKFADTVSLNWVQWGICILLAAFTWPLGWIVKCIPVPKMPFLSYFKFSHTTT
ncbi:calcium-transporting ATPase 12, plasma membrane-type-like [Olea europaea subsp. europaea]|uniref:Calcium-transporting ATPase n=1 Tax=Olea europaea subsp. europaea TaxID=158383 RepID=A0A8S0V7C1_OLEEU|nr:calcium-transporting ATPase 12, plasma membrane-type-like [Olea europaea subsp. europaea]